MEFHISRQTRDRYEFDASIFSLSGNAIIANFQAARVFAQKVNAQRDLIRFPEQAVKAGQINAMGLIDEISHFIIRQYRQQKNPQVMTEAIEWLYAYVGQEAVDSALQQFTDEFPALAVYRQETPLEEYLGSETEGVPNKQIALEEMLMLWLSNVNPAFSPYREFFDDRALETNTAYLKIITSLRAFFNTQPPFGPQNLSLVDLLRAPALASPHSLAGQVKFMHAQWAVLLDKYLPQLLRGLDMISEEEKPVFFGPGPARVYNYIDSEMLEDEHFSPDKDWMPQLVLLAKNAYVWLDQLSKQYQRPITRLDQVPDDELDKLARWGFSGLWLIGLWERSSASKRIKQMCGNPDAVSSAYSLYDYIIAANLGGEEAYQNLRRRAWQRGIRLAADMVPNHVGIYSKWVVEHPDWFVSLDHSPFPAYTFNGENLSEDGRVGIYLEDHYYTRNDAAVVFERVDHWTGGKKYIYHGNDGTAMPWNDTAQLNYLNPEAREAVIQTILHVARKFPVIRFDAAMTLAKKHFHRLWFPEPGAGGDIPSRSELGLTREQFDAAMPVEFWREVVDRIAEEVPDTLLLAEAFWMMEGYFVRTLGMHRVYNSAFMNMLRDEKNDQYRQLIKNTLEFDPQILKRYVNFMNNPDEKTTIKQFGKDDKYFGTCTMMVTMPGLPMFGHGQVEGLHEKYGMEYYRAYWDEAPDTHLVQRHKREIFPLLHRRHLFAEMDNFLLYDFYTADTLMGAGGHVDENVFAYSNRVENGRSLVIYHNRWADVRGWIKTSAAYKDKNLSDDALVRKDLGDGLGLRNDERHFTIFREHVSGLEYIRNNRELHERGLYVELGAYKYQVFLDFREVADNEWGQYAQLAAHLNGRGVPNMEEALRELFLQPLHYSFRELVNAGMFRWLIENGQTRQPANVQTLLIEVEQKMLSLLRAVKNLTECECDETSLAQEIGQKLDAALHLPILATRYPLPGARKYAAAIKLMAGADDHPSIHAGDPLAWGIIFGWLFTHALGKAVLDADYPERSRGLLEEWLLHKIIVQTLQDLDLDEEIARNAFAGIKILIGHQNWFQDRSPKKGRADRILQTWLEDIEVQRFLRINRHNDILWFNKEAFEQVLRGMLTVATVATLADPDISDDRVAQEIVSHYDVIKKLGKAARESGYQVEGLQEAAK
ncbi:MAG: alpha-amylase [Chloroflexi bacterium]|nr:alpha-amylase [Chloroflexota bacterium]